jgi:hypothetical protein
MMTDPDTVALVERIARDTLPLNNRAAWREFRTILVANGRKPTTELADAIWTERKRLQAAKRDKRACARS